MILWDPPVWPVSYAGLFLPHKLVMQKVECGDKKSTLALFSTLKVFGEAMGTAKS